MSISTSVVARSFMLFDGLSAAIAAGSADFPSVRLWQTNTELVSFPLAALPFTSGAGAIIAIGAPIVNTATATVGTANRFTVHNADETLLISGTVSAIGGGGDIETPSLAITQTGAGNHTLNAFIIRQETTGELLFEASISLF